MCLYIIPRKTAQLKAKLEKYGEITAYKKFIVFLNNKTNTFELETPFQCIKLTLNRNNAFASNRKSNKITAQEKSQGYINYGIHSYRNDFSTIRPEIVIPVTIKKEHFVAAGRSNDIVATRIYIDPTVLKNKVNDYIKENKLLPTKESLLSQITGMENLLKNHKQTIIDLQNVIVQTKIKLDRLDTETPEYTLS